MKLVIKIGTSTLTHPTGLMDVRKVTTLCRVISDLKNAGHEIVLVSSGAIGMGVGKLHLAERPTDIPTKQAAAAVGQCELMDVYDRMFGEYHHTVAQILLTNDDFTHEDRHTNFTNTLNRLLSLGALPIINENDTVATGEIKLGDNDTLSALVAVSVKADLLVLLSDVDGLYTADPRKDPHATLVQEVSGVTSALEQTAGSAGSARGTGGMKTKLSAAKLCNERGITVALISGDHPDLLYDAVEGKPFRGTRFLAEGEAK